MCGLLAGCAGLAFAWSSSRRGDGDGRRAVVAFWHACLHALAAWWRDSAGTLATTKSFRSSPSEVHMHARSGWRCTPHSHQNSTSRGGKDAQDRAKSGGTMNWRAILVGLTVSGPPWVSSSIFKLHVSPSPSGQPLFPRRMDGRTRTSPWFNGTAVCRGTRGPAPLALCRGPCHWWRRPAPPTAVPSRPYWR